MVKCDADRIREILNNLVSNAVKFTKEGYVAVKVDVEPREKGNDDASVVLRFEVKDTGTGIDLKRQVRLFERFEQGDLSLTRKHAGSGLGLAICKELCVLFGGRIGVTSAPGKGSQFMFTVPCRVAARAARRPRRQHGAQAKTVANANGVAAQIKTLDILVVDDNDTNQVILRDILEQGGHRIDVAENGQEAVFAAAHKRYDLILMDVRMPVMDGLEATRQIRLYEPNRPHVLIFALTAHAMNGARNECLAAGMDDYISKPFTIAQINGTIAKHFKAA